MSRLEEISSDDKLKFHARTQALVDSWAKMASTAATPQTDGAATNGAAASKAGAKAEADADAPGDVIKDVDAPEKIDTKADGDRC